MDGAKSPVCGLVLALCHFLRLGGTFCCLRGLGGLWGILRGHSCAEKEKKEAKKKRLGSGVGTHCKKYLGGLKMWRVCACYLILSNSIIGMFATGTRSPVSMWIIWQAFGKYSHLKSFATSSQFLRVSFSL